MKVHSRCNLSCDYCYVYQHADQSWRARPMVMSREVIDQTAARIAEHALKHDLPFILVIMHGGEPLLAGLPVLDYVATAVTAAVDRQTRVVLGLQTNGVLVDNAFLELAFRHDIRIGVSIDGPATTHDRHRRHSNGLGSHAATTAAIELLRLPRYRHLFGGLLVTIDRMSDPIDVYEHVLRADPPEVDFLLPHGTWSTPPPGRLPASAGTPYADWLIPIFDRWYGAAMSRTRIGLFESIISLLLGGPSGSEALGINRVDLVSVETDGTLEQADSLKVTQPGMAATGLHVCMNSFDDYLEHPGARARQVGLAGLSRTCRNCALVQVCGGGLYAHRYRASNGFDNPSVYCPDLAKLIRHVAGRLATDLAV